MSEINQPQQPLVISCDTCVMQKTSACDDCLMSFLCGDPHETAVVFDLAEQRAVRLLANAGMVPTLRHRAVI
ncbi:unannotated protein [freshwater metagenome]|uniref:Unannotated protein n=1 Tax=freshwater metagenome TaxID=449393 RepID=A0A6J6X7P0_9ZZZZ